MPGHKYHLGIARGARQSAQVFDLALRLLRSLSSWAFMGCKDPLPKWLFQVWERITVATGQTCHCGVWENNMLTLINSNKALCWVLVGFNLPTLNSVLGRITQTPSLKLGLTYLPLVPLDFNNAVLFSRGQRGEAGVQQVPCRMEETFQREK